jgi:hypothetical protein
VNRVPGKCAALALLGLVGVLALATACGETTTAGTATATGSANPPAAPQERVEFGHIRWLARHGDGFELRFDPAWFLSGVTANVAAAEDGVVEPGEPVPNDNYVVDDDHRLLTYEVPADAAVTVLTRDGDPAQLGATPITVAELARILDGTSDLSLFEPVETGFWIAVDIDTVRSLHQQYRS